MDGRTRRRTTNDDGHDQQRSEYEDRSESKKPRLGNGETESQGRWSSGNVEHFLAFEPTEIPKWRLETRTTDAPTISEMLKDIVIYKGTYERLKGTSTEAERKKIHRWLLVRFLCTIQKEEDIGVQEETLTESIMEDIDKEINGAMSTRVEQLLQNKSELLYQRHNSLELPSLDFDEIGNMHDKIQETGKTPTKSAKETINLYRAYKHIKDELKKSMDDMAEANTPKKENDDFFSGKHDSKGFIEVESLIKYTHRILMEDIMHEGTPPGNFSTYPRTAEFNGKTHEYPTFENVAVAEQAIQTLVDKVNEIIESIRKKNVSDEEKAKLYFKCSSLFLFCFLSLHPFGDGNGRLARLLSSYNLLTFSPFLTPIYNVFSATRKCDYVQALVDAEQGLGEARHITVKDEAINMSISAMEQKPSDLCSMLIESNWTVWRQLLVKLGDKTIKLYKWEIENQNL